MSIHTTLSDYGHYTIPNSSKIYYNKLEAVMDLKEGEYPSWNFNEEFFSKFDWSIEPDDPIDLLYKRRLEELRNKYDYLVLHLSGGWDSGTILATALANNIFIDEIITRGPIPDTANSNDLSAENCYLECYLSAMPLAQKAKEKWPSMVFTVANTKKYALDFFNKNKDWMFMHNQIVVGVHRYDLDQLSPSVADAGQKHKTVGHIVGIDKPRLYKNNGHFYFNFLDILVTNHINQRFTSIDVPMAVELFYWAPTVAATQIMIKQGHILKQFFKMTNQDPSKFLWSRSTHHLVGSLIYPSTPVPLWFTEKASDIPEWDNWFYKDKNTDYYRNWKNGLDYIAQTVPTYLQNKGNAALHGMVGCISGRYDLGD